MWQFIKQSQNGMTSESLTKFPSTQLHHKIIITSLTLDMSLRPRSILGRGFLSKMPASYGDTMAGLTKRRNMALPTAPMLFCGNRWLTTCVKEDGGNKGRQRRGKQMGNVEQMEQKTKVWAKGKEKILKMDFSTLKSKGGNDENNKIYMYQCVWQSKERWAMAKTVKDVMFRRRKTHEERLRNNPSSFWSVTRAGEVLTPVTAQEREKKGRARQGTQRSPLCLWRKKKGGWQM